MEIRFPIVINRRGISDRRIPPRGLGMRAWPRQSRTRGSKCYGRDRYGDLSNSQQQQSRAPAFVMSIDDEGIPAPARTSIRRWSICAIFIEEVRWVKTADVPIYIY